MDYRKWLHRDAALLVEKYSGEVDIDQLMLNAEQNLLEVKKQLIVPRILTDLREARFPDVNDEMVEMLMDPIDRYPEKAVGLKLALYIGANYHSDFKKIFNYARLASQRKVSVVPFVNINDAFDWLGIATDEQRVICKQLNIEQ
ncbi:MAG: hypothetical protein KDD94_02195 [Calditrichaeota bacterium]|nr:hypothetical protein [Calditrichota bacterium]